MALINFLKKKKEQIDKAIPDLNVKQKAVQAVKQVGKGISNIERASQEAGLRARQQVNRAAPIVVNKINQTPIVGDITRPLGQWTQDVSNIQKTQGTLPAAKKVGSDVSKLLLEIPTIQDVYQRGLDAKLAKQAFDESAKMNQLAYTKKDPNERIRLLNLSEKIKQPYIGQIGKDKNLQPLEVLKGAAEGGLTVGQFLPGGTQVKAGTLLAKVAPAIKLTTGIGGFKKAAEDIATKSIFNAGKDILARNAAQGVTNAAISSIPTPETKDMTAKERAKQFAKQAVINTLAGTALEGVAGAGAKGVTKTIEKTAPIVTKVSQDIAKSLQEPKFQPGFASTKPKVELKQKQPKVDLLTQEARKYKTSEEFKSAQMPKAVQDEFARKYGNLPIEEARKKADEIFAQSKIETPKITAKSEELAREGIQKAVKEPISPEIAPIARVSTKVEPKVSPEPKIEAKKVVETSIDPTDPFGNRNRINQIRNELGSLVDSDYKMLNTLRRIEKETGAKGLVDQFEFDTGNIRASRAMANAKIRQSQELSDALSGLNKKQAQNFDEYIKARAELENYTPEMKTSKPREELARIVAAGDAEFSDRFGSINQYYKNMAQDMYEGGLIDQNTLNRYLADDNYVRLQRDVEDLVGAMPGKSGARSIRTTTAKQRRTGSERELLSPTQSLLKRTQQIELEIQRNKAANNIIDTLVEYGLATPVKQSKNKNTIARLVNGKKELFEVNGEIKQIIDNVSPYNLGVLAQIVSTPTRIFRAGTTALSAPFSIINYLRDQASSAIYSKNTLVTHNPVNIITALKDAIVDQAKGNEDEIWKIFIKYLGDQTVYDELRNVANSKRLLREKREGQVGRFKNAILDPIRTIEDINSITELATRWQNFRGIYKEVIKRGLSKQDTIREAVLAARRNSVDFNKGSDFTRVINLFIPYFNASVQGTRNVVQAFAQRPVRTALKSVGYIAIPSVLATAYNLADETRREAYNSIDDFEKENNFIIIGPDAKQNEQGTWTGIYKIPKPQGYKELTDPVRDVTEAFLQGESVDNVGKMFYDMLGAVSGPFNIQSPEKFLGSIIPQAIKPTIQAGLNKDIFTGKNIVPQYMVEQTDDPTKRAFEGTSGTARIIGEQLGVSPLQVEQFTKGTTGSLGQYTTNLIDQALASAGIISKEQVGGKNIIEDVTRRLFEASGELPENKKPAGQKYFESVNEVKKDLSAQDQKAWDTLHSVKTNFLGEEVFNENKRISKYTKAGIYLNNPNVLEADRKLNQLMVQKGNPSNPFFELPEPLQKQVLLKEALPPGSKDPILSALYKEEWFQDYQKARSDYYEQVKANMAKQGKELPKSTNPYPTTPPELQKTMNYYSSLPKGTGERSQWIKANPGLWQQMTAQWQQVDAWENKERVAMGIPEIVQEDTTKKYNSGKGGKGGKKSKTLKIKGSLPIVELRARPKLAAIKLKRKATAPAIKLAPTRKAKPKKLTIRNIRVK